MDDRNDTIDYLENEITVLIENAPEEYKERLRATQSKCDLIRLKYKDNPIGSMVAIQAMMHESLAELNTQMKRLKGVLEGKGDSAPSKREAKILTFKRKEDKND